MCVLEPVWTNEQPTRFLVLVQYIPNLTDPYWQAPLASNKAGACFSIPLGYGFQFNAEDTQIANAAANAFIGHPVRIVSIQRTRLTTRKGGQPMQDGVILEVYSMEGTLLWKNPIKSLDDAIAEGHQILRSLPSSSGAAPKSIPQSQPTLSFDTKPSAPQVLTNPTEQPESRKTQYILELHSKYSQSKSGDELIALIHKISKAPMPVVRAVLLQVERDKKTKDPNLEKVEEAFKEVSDLALDDDLLLNVLVDMTTLSSEIVAQALQSILNPVPTTEVMATIKPPAQAAIKQTETAELTQPPSKPVRLQPSTDKAMAEQRNILAYLQKNDSATAKDLHAFHLTESGDTECALTSFKQRSLRPLLETKEIFLDGATKSAVYMLSTRPRRSETVQSFVLNLLKEKLTPLSLRAIFDAYLDSQGRILQPNSSEDSLEPNSEYNSLLKNLRENAIYPLLQQGKITQKGKTKFTVYSLAPRQS
jgi:hypothetical protein